jgi:uncharacterized protein YjiS (DUF1127 family)
MAYANETLSVGGSLAQRLRQLSATFADRRARYGLYRKTLRELEGLTERDLTDLGLSRSNIRDVAYQAAYRD